MKMFPVLLAYSLHQQKKQKNVSFSLNNLFSNENFNDLQKKGRTVESRVNK